MNSTNSGSDCVMLLLF